MKPSRKRTLLLILLLGGLLFWVMEKDEDMSTALAIEADETPLLKTPLIEESIAVEAIETLEPSSAVESVPYIDVPYALDSKVERYNQYGSLNDHLSEEDIVLKVNMNLDKDFYGHIIEVTDPEPIWVMCNKFYKLPSDYEPSHLVRVPSEHHLNDGKEYWLVKEALDAYANMSRAASDQGVSLTIVSAYRSNAYQKRLYNNYVQRHGQAAADRFSARPGHSEHETGLAIDLNQISEAFENTEAFKWLRVNAHKFGYILRYPKGLEAETGYMYEPWHYRYVGAEIATNLFENEMTFDAYYAMHLLND